MITGFILGVLATLAFDHRAALIPIVKRVAAELKAMFTK